jgi:hypothetical protein
MHQVGHGVNLHLQLLGQLTQQLLLLHLRCLLLITGHLLKEWGNLIHTVLVAQVEAPMLSFAVALGAVVRLMVHSHSTWVLALAARTALLGFGVFGNQILSINGLTG